MEIIEEMVADLRSSTSDVDGVPILHLKGNEDLTFDIPIPNLEKTVETGPTEGGQTPIWSFDGGFIEINSDDRGPDGATLYIQLTDENTIIYLIEMRRYGLNKLRNLLVRERNRQRKQKQRANKKQKGRNLAAFRQTMGNRRGLGPNPVPELLASSIGPGALIASFLSGKNGSPKNQARQVEHMGVHLKPKPLPPANNTMPNLAPNGGARRTRRRRN